MTKTSISPSQLTLSMGQQTPYQSTPAENFPVQGRNLSISSESEEEVEEKKVDTEESTDGLNLTVIPKDYHEQFKIK